MANDLLSALRTYLSKVTSGDKTPQEIAAALNAWAKDSGEAIRIRVEEEIARSAKKMGFAKQADLDKLARELEELRFHLVGAAGKRPTTAVKKPGSSAKSSAKKKLAPKKNAPKKSTNSGKKG